MQLVIDTTQSETLIALLADEAVLDFSVLELQNRHSERLLLEIDGLLAGHNIKKEQLSKLLCVTGPGSYTGTRVGVSTTNALRFGLGVKSVGITKPEILQKLHPEAEGALAVPSYKGHFWVYNVKSGKAEMLSEEDLVSQYEQIYIFDKASARDHAFDFNYTEIDYKNKEAIEKWVLGCTFKEKDLKPLYFKAPTITTPKK